MSVDQVEELEVESQALFYILYRDKAKAFAEACFAPKRCEFKL